MKHEPQPRPLSIYIVAAEESGDALGASLARALLAQRGGAVKLAGVGGRAMAAAGIASPFPIEELSIIGLSAIPRRLPMILRRIRETADCDRRRTAGCARHHRQPRLHPPGGPPRAAPGACDSDSRLCLAVGLGLAAGTRARDARLCRLRARHSAIRAGRACPARRSALYLCRSSADRARRGAASRCG